MEILHNPKGIGDRLPDRLRLLYPVHGKSLLDDSSFIDSMQFITLDSKGNQTGQSAAPDAKAVNGMVKLENGQYLAAVSIAGTIWLVDVKNETVESWLNDERTTLRAKQEMFVPGANGLKRRADGIAVSNTSRGTPLQITVDSNGQAVVKPALLADVGMNDDFWVNPDDSILFTTHGKELK